MRRLSVSASSTIGLRSGQPFRPPAACDADLRSGDSPRTPLTASWGPLPGVGEPEGLHRLAEGGLLQLGEVGATTAVRRLRSSRVSGGLTPAAQGGRVTPAARLTAWNRSPATFGESGVEAAALEGDLLGLAAAAARLVAGGEDGGEVRPPRPAALGRGPRSTTVHR